MKKILCAALAGAAFLATPASAEVVFDADAGTGFVGKGDVQLAFGLNNAALQNGTFAFTTSSVSEASWTCDRDAGPQTQERTRTTTAYGVVSALARVRNQITGFSLNGYSGPVSTETEGPPLLSCPTGWTAINLEETELGGDGVVFVSHNGGTPVPLN